MEYLNEEGYPTEEYLNWLEDWESWMQEETHESMIPNILQSLKESWTWVDYFKISRVYKGKFKVELHTGGWSGNESIIRALKENFIFWHHWTVHKAGGHYYFEFPKKYLI